MTRCFNRRISDVKDGVMTGPMGTIRFGAGDLYIEVEDSRRDEDPRHKWCPERVPGRALKGLSLDCGFPLTMCHRCQRPYIELLVEWMEEQAPGWNQGKETGLGFSEVDPKRRSSDQGQRDFENSICDGERRKRESWSMEHRDD